MWSVPNFGRGHDRSRPIANSALADFPQHTEDSTSSLANPTKQVTTITRWMENTASRDPKHGPQVTVRRTRNPLRNSAINLAYWILQSREDAEDAVQDAYVRAFQAFDTSRALGRAPGFWPSCATLPIAPWMLVGGHGT